MLEVDGVSKSFGGIRAVGAVSLSVNPGETLGLIGPNGAGKTTLFNLISGIMKPDSGSLKLEGRTISGLKPHVISRLGVARTFQTPRPFAGMSVSENLMVGHMFGKGRTRSPGAARRKAVQVLDLISLADKSEESAEALTLSEQRRLELGRALATDPKLLMLDEAMAGLTLHEALEMVSLIKRLKQERGLTLLVTEHVTQTIVELCERVVVMSRGEKLAEGATREVLQKDSVVFAFMGAGARKQLPS